MLVALGMSLVIATGGVDLSVGAIVAISGSLVAVLLSSAGLNPLVAMSLAIGAGALCGLWNGTLVAVLRVQPIVATLILMVAGRGIAQLITDGQIIPIESSTVNALSGGHLLGLPATIWLTVAALIATALLVRKTAMGLFIEAVGNNEVASRYSGVHASGVKLFAYTFAGFCAGVAGLLVAANIQSADANNAGRYLELDAILAVVIGGTALTGGRFYLASTLVGALFIQALSTTITSQNLPVEYTLVIKALAVLVVCLLKSDRLWQLVQHRLGQCAPARRGSA
jgi:simple sugar transport system permease protein